MRTDDTERSFILPFQCSSASRKFLNRDHCVHQLAR